MGHREGDFLWPRVRIALRKAGPRQAACTNLLDAAAVQVSLDLQPRSAAEARAMDPLRIDSDQSTFLTLLRPTLVGDSDPASSVTVDRFAFLLLSVFLKQRYRPKFLRYHHWCNLNVCPPRSFVSVAM